jgi:hypothetical protein
MRVSKPEHHDLEDPARSLTDRSREPFIWQLKTLRKRR